jgi:hypothetical protein
METKEKLTYTEKQSLRRLYAEYREIKFFDEFGERNYDTLEEVNQARAEVKALMLKAAPALGEDFNVRYIPEAIYSANQLRFIEEAEDDSLDIDYGYSGRGMFGDCCPSVTVGHTSDFSTSAKYQTDSMGLDIVMYAQH